MAEMLIAVAGTLFGSGGTAAATAGTAASTGFSLSTVLQGIATVGGVVASLGASAAQAQAQELAAADAEQEQQLENLQGIERRRSIRASLRDALGAQDVAYAASGVDLSFGTAAQARSDAYREADLALTADNGTQLGRSARLMERAANYRSAAKRTKRFGAIKALAGGAGQAASIFERG